MRHQWLRRLTPAAGPRIPPAPCFRPTSRQTGADDDTATDSDDEITDLASGMISDPTGSVSDPPTRRTAATRAAKCLIGYNVHWGGVEGAADPCLAAVELLHVARQSVDTSRWWTMRWPQNAVSLVGRAGALISSFPFWMLTSDRRHSKDDIVLVTELKTNWCRVQKLLGRSRDKAGSLVRLD